MEKAINPYFSVELSAEPINKIREKTKKILVDQLNLDIENLSIPHVSISYILGELSIKTLEEIAENIVEAPFFMKIKGFKIFGSEYYKGMIISVSLDHSDDFLYSQEFLKEIISSEDVTIKEYNGGFKAHISLFVIKGLSKENKELLPRYLEMAVSELNLMVWGEKFSIYNNERQKVLEKKFN